MKETEQQHEIVGIIIVVALFMSGVFVVHEGGAASFGYNNR